jgi:seryl-tRNA synthetase
MNMDMRCVQLTTTNNELNNLSNQINTLSNQIKSQISRLQNKTLTVNQQQQLNEIVLNTQFKNIDKVQNSVTQYQESSVNARNIKNDSQLVVLKENQSFILWSVLAISVALITIHVIR